MTAYQRARAKYDDELDLAFLIAKCARIGIVHFDEECALVAIPIDSSFMDNDDVDESLKVLDNADAWYVYICAGSMKKAFDLVPYKPFVIYERFDGKFRKYSFERMRRLCHG